jgi:hypothetical protein
LPAAQSVSAAQVLVQAAPVHLKGEQSSVAGVGAVQAPVPSQSEARVSTVPMQLAEAQRVPFGNS